jgi:hypothetical protein
VAADTVGLEGLGGVVVVPAAALGQVAEREPVPWRQGHHRTAGAVAARPERVREGVPAVEVADLSSRSRCSMCPGEQDWRGVSYFDGWGRLHLTFGLTPA